MKIGLKSQFAERYIRVIIVVYALIFLFRIVESALIFFHYDYTDEVLFNEFIGLCYDILGASIFIIGYAILFFFLSKVKSNIRIFVNGGLIFVLTLFFLLIIKYFIYQLVPLDIFLYKYSIREIIFTIKTSNTNFLLTFAGIATILLVAAVVAWGAAKIKFKLMARRVVFFSVLVSFPLFFLAKSFDSNEGNKYSMNKPMFFIKESVKYLFNHKEVAAINTSEIKKLYPEKDFISEEYPLVYNIERENKLRTYFNKFESSPNIVLLIIEGLNDDFIHQYKGAVLMPFLNELKDKSLYWRRCFSVGERSFAALPSILGGLPYGDKGFTLQERLPRHLSLVSVLNSNGYFTSFYYGQGAWFHKKNRFFKHNDIDLIFDKGEFSDDYDKIIVGDNHFFWGYNDKDLFSQSFKVIDTLNQNKRFDIYFTGTSHSPFVINNESFYNNKLKEITTGQNRDFFQTYFKYLKTLLFVDDALKNFFSEYKKRADYENTVFIITGDHPMTEVPIANSLKRYHVPLIIFSERLKEHHTFAHTVSHLDIPESILSFLQEYSEHIPSISTSLGEMLSPKDKSLPGNIAFMNDNREVVDFLYGDYYLSENNLYFVDPLLTIEKIENDSVRSTLARKLSAFKQISLHVTRNNKIISKDMYSKMLNHLNIFEYSQADSVQTSSEYYKLADNIRIPNIDFTFDISLNITSNKKKDISVVYHITNSKDSTLLWRNFGINEDKITQAHISIDKIHVNDTAMFFHSYIWNTNKYDLNISDIDILLHSSKPTSVSSN